MVDVLFEQRVVQNPALAAESIWQAVRETYEATGRADGVTLPLTFLVLPLTFHRRTAGLLATKTQPGAMYKALADDREITVGLQARMQAMSSRTFQALNIGLRSGLLRLDAKNDFEITPGKRTPPVMHVTDDVKTILNAAKRDGHAFSEMSVAQLTANLGIRF